MRVSLLLPLTVAFAAQPLLAKDREPITLKSSSKWVVDYDNDACHLMKQFGTGDQVLLAKFTRYQPGDVFDLGLYGTPAKLPGPVATVRIDFGLAPQPISAAAVLGNAGDKPMMLFSSLRLDGYTWYSKDSRPLPAPAIAPEQEARVTAIVLRLPGNRAYRLESGELGKPLAALRECQANLLKHWGYDPAVQLSLVRPATPINSPGSWLGSSDYPKKALDSGIQGMVQFRLDVSETGAVAGCSILFRTNPDEFADTTCKNIAKRAKLLPALDAKGAPVRSYYIQKVRWQP